jgi:adenylate kinase family enzyme
MTPPNIILLGDPASGKSTHSRGLARRYGFTVFGMGEELRKIERDPRIERTYHLRAMLAKGALAPTRLARRIIRDKMRSIPRSKGILFDGHPKMLGEARLLARILRAQKRTEPIVIYLAIPLAHIVARMRMRQRPDDSVTALKNRRKYYQKNLRAAVAFYKRHFSFRVISGRGSRREVMRRITTYLDRQFAVRRRSV